MCGIAGILTAGQIDQQLLLEMGDAIAHRGPDDASVWIDNEAGVGLSHRRLSIVDLTPLGRQPMASSDGRWVLVFNGEIYNYDSLRKELEGSGRGPAAAGRQWRGHSDTETLIECIATWGIEPTLEKCAGMFAFALWDRKERRLQLVRDRFGEKPLYYGWTKRGFAFGSELKAIRGVAGFANAIDERAVRLLAARGYIPAPLSIYRDIYKLLPGTILSLSTDAVNAAPGAPIELGVSAAGIGLRAYWSYRELVRQGIENPILTEREALEELDGALRDAIRGQTVADVPVGAFLSGGIDSSTVVALYHKYSATKLRTFSIGFDQEAFDEARYAKEVAAYFGAEHNERYVTVQEAQEVIPLLPALYDEPFADSSQIPTYLVSKFAREQVTVALSGDGSDELFGGYNRYLGTARLWSHMKRLPRPVRIAAGRSLGALPTGAWNQLGSLLPSGRRRKHFGTKVQKAFRTMARAEDVTGVFDSFLDEWAGQPSPALYSGEMPAQCAFDMDLGRDVPDAVRMMYCDATSYLPDDILCKVDRAAMAVSLETRVPFLDHRVAAVAARIPFTMKIRGGTGKLIVRQLLYREAPRALFERPKTGFGVPIGEWIRGPLRDWAEDLLDAQKMASDGFFDPRRVHCRWQQHLSGENDSTAAVWAVLMFQAWLREHRAPLTQAAA